MLAYIGVSLILGSFFLLISAGHGQIMDMTFGLGLFIFLMGLILGILAASSKKDEREAFASS